MGPANQGPPIKTVDRKNFAWEKKTGLAKGKRGKPSESSRGWPRRPHLERTAALARKFFTEEKALGKRTCDDQRVEAVKQKKGLYSSASYHLLGWT